MKKRILGLSILVGSAVLAGCSDPSKDNSSVLQNALLQGDGGAGGGYDFVGINQADIPGFENASGTTPTQVTITFSGGASAAVAAGCILMSPGDLSVLPDGVFSVTTISSSTATYGLTGIGDSILGGLYCGNTGPQTADLRISFTVGGKNYSATTTLASGT